MRTFEDMINFFERRFTARKYIQHAIWLSIAATYIFYYKVQDQLMRREEGQIHRTVDVLSGPTFFQFLEERFICSDCLAQDFNG